MTPAKQLDQKLGQIKKVFNVDDILALKPDKKYIQKYYRASRIAYSMFYWGSDRMYMGISRDGVYKEQDLLEAARVVEKYIKELSAHNVLELATGRGATSTYLAQRHPKIRFAGIELSSAQLGLAKKKSRKLPNYTPIVGDYHDLGQYDDGSVDIVFVIEALCYSTDKATVLSEVKRVLRKDGVFIIFDGYTTKNRTKMAKNELLACKLTEKSMALDIFEDYNRVMQKAKQNGFSVIYNEDVSEFILPTLKKFERWAKAYFNRPLTAKASNVFLPKKTAYNTVAGLLMPDVVSQGLLGYYITVLKAK